ncbi:MAG: hypothetical protein U9Q37_00970 [Euryarchaeota archaeon]|nr:hypothetical protein [Euryarchaeota archaeon]
MSCNDATPWTPTYHPHTVNRLRVTSGGSTNQSTGAWTPETTSSTEICGYIGRGTTGGTTGMFSESIESLAGGLFKTGDQMYICRSDCDVTLNDILEVFDDAAGTTKTYWRVITKLKELTTFKNLRGYGMIYWLVRMEER